MLNTRISDFDEFSFEPSKEKQLHYSYTNEQKEKINFKTIDKSDR